MTANILYQLCCETALVQFFVNEFHYWILKCAVALLFLVAAWLCSFTTSLEMFLYLLGSFDQVMFMTVLHLVSWSIHVYIFLFWTFLNVFQRSVKASCYIALERYEAKNLSVLFHSCQQWIFFSCDNWSRCGDLSQRWAHFADFLVVKCIALAWDPTFNSALMLLIVYNRQVVLAGDLFFFDLIIQVPLASTVLASRKSIRWMLVWGRLGQPSQLLMLEMLKRRDFEQMKTTGHIERN